MHTAAAAVFVTVVVALLSWLSFTLPPPSLSSSS